MDHATFGFVKDRNKKEEKKRCLRFLYKASPFWRYYSDILDLVFCLNVIQEQNGLLGQVKQKGISVPCFELALNERGFQSLIWGNSIRTIYEEQVEKWTNSTNCNEVKPLWEVSGWDWLPLILRTAFVLPPVAIHLALSGEGWPRLGSFSQRTQPFIPQLEIRLQVQRGNI